MAAEILQGIFLSCPHENYHVPRFGAYDIGAAEYNTFSSCGVIRHIMMVLKTSKGTIMPPLFHRWRHSHLTITKIITTLVSC